MVVGQGRSGTSFLINVLAANPDNGALLHWEAMFPCPPPEKATYRSDPRIEKADRLIRPKPVTRAPRKPSSTAPLSASSSK